MYKSKITHIIPIVMISIKQLMTRYCYDRLIECSVSADGIALGAAITLPESHITYIVFLAIMLHKVSVPPRCNIA